MNSFILGGAELMVKRLCFASDPSRVRCSVMAISDYSEKSTAIFTQGFEERGLRCECLGKPAFRKSPAAIVNLMRHIRRGDYDIVHMHCWSPSIYGRLAATLVPGTKRVVTIHTSMSSRDVRWERLLAPLTDQFVACSTETEVNLRSDCGFRESQFTRILNGTAGDRTSSVTKNRDEIREALGVKPDEQVGLVVARIDAQKAHLDLLEALTRPGERISKLKVWIVGNDRTEYAGQVRAAISDKNLDSRVKILGLIEDHEIDEVMKGADFFLLPSIFEGMSVAIIEALAAGLPTVISDLETNREVTDDGRVGYLTPPGNPVALAEALNEILSSPDEMVSRGREAAAYAAEQFGFDRVVREYTELYERLLSG
jgi:glycosyltransferase involved in cell wall biosynthesis